jgi:NADH:ubiquinone oxidoreductase subunit B-like Fe-S oxidoreductase
LEIPNKHH